MKFVVLSDIHADVNPWKWTMLDNVDPDVDVAVVSGDIDNNVWQTCHWLIELKKRFNTVIWVAGNHDFYNLGFHETRLSSLAWEKLWPYPYTVDEIYKHYERWSIEHGLIFLHRTSAVVNGVTFIGATGWHDYVAGEPYPVEQQIHTWYNCINDTVIKWNKASIKPDHLAPYDAGVKDVNSISHMVEQATNPVVVLTHHVPHRQLLWHRPEQAIWTMLHGSFANTKLEKIVNPKIKYWIYGHTHQRNMKQIGDTLYICNARGYRHENPNWEPIVLEI